MGKSRMMLFLLLSSCIWQIGYAQVLTPPVVDPVDTVLYATYDCHFASAISIADSMIAHEPGLLKWKFIRAMINWRQIYLEGKDPALESEFTRRIDDLVQLGRRNLDRDPNDTISLFYTGAALEYLGLYDASSDEVMKAASEGKEGLSYHERLLLLNPRCYDAYLSLGLFNSFASNAPWYMKPILWILGRSGSAERAREYLSLAATKSTLARTEAMEGLAQFHEMREERDSAFAIYQDLMRMYPHCTLYSLNAVRMLFSRREFSESAVLGDKVIASSDTTSQGEMDVYRLGLVIVLISQSYENLGQTTRAIEPMKLLEESRYERKFGSFANLSLGHLYWKIGDRDKSKMSYERVLAINRVPNHVQEAREQLELHSENR
jgi:tetratricopeptide (TPR) repeat protein